MKSLCWFILFFQWASVGYAAEDVSTRFSLLSLKCEAEAGNEIDTTPQSPPLDVDDPGTPGCNRWEINALFDGDISRNASNWDLPLLDINYGIGDNLQFKYELPYVSNQADHSAISGVGTSKIGIKYKFFDSEISEVQLAVYPQVDFVTPGSQAIEKGLAIPGTIKTIPFLISKKLGQTGHGDIILTANLGYNLSTRADTTDFVSAAGGVGLPLFRKVSLMAEISTEQALVNDTDLIRESLIKANLGALATLSKQFMIYGSVGQSMYASDQLNHTYVLAGIKLLTGGAAISRE